MKDRWKILTCSLVTGFLMACFLAFLFTSLKSVELREYGLLEYTYFHTVDGSQQVRSNGNYLIGLDYAFIKYPKGIISHSFVTQFLTSDKSLLSIEGLFMGRLIESEIVNLHFAYGPTQFIQVIQVSVQQLFREALEQFQLSEIISKRQQVSAYVLSYTCLNLQSRYSWIQCNLASIGEIVGWDAEPVILPPETQIANDLCYLINQTIIAQRKKNIYDMGGADLLSFLEQTNAGLFNNVTKLLVDIIGTAAQGNSQSPQEVFAGAVYVLNNPALPILTNQIPFNLTTLS